MRVHRNSISDLADRLCYGAIPALCLRNGAGRGMLLLEEKPAGLNLLAGAALLLLVVNIRNAWDLMLSLARRQASELHKTDTAPPSQPPSH